MNEHDYMETEHLEPGEAERIERELEAIGAGLNQLGQAFRKMGGDLRSTARRIDGLSALLQHTFSRGAVENRTLVREAAKAAANRLVDRGPVAPLHEEARAAVQAEIRSAAAQMVEQVRRELEAAWPNNARDMLLGSLSKVTVEPGDRFVLQLKRPVADQDAAGIHAVWDQYFPGTPLLVLADGAELKKAETQA